MQLKTLGFDVSHMACLTMLILNHSISNKTLSLSLVGHINRISTAIGMNIRG